MRLEDSAIGLVSLRRDEALIDARPAPIVRPDRALDPITAMARLTGVEDDAAIGSRPAMAGTAVAGNDDREFRLFEALFGRDALFIARFAQSRWPTLPLATFDALAALQGLPLELAPEPDQYARRLERPGRIPHETRADDDPIARQLVHELGWAFPYYHSDDATPIFVRDLARCALEDPGVLARRVTRRDGAVGTLLDALRAGLDHVRDSLGPEHLLVSHRGPDDELGGLHSYPVWQDSPDAHFLPDGTLAHGPAAIFEVQTYVYDALLAVATLVEHDPRLATLLGVPGELRGRAQALAGSVFTHFWREPGHFVPGVAFGPGGITPFGGRKSTMGAALDSGLLFGARQEYVGTLVTTMFDVDQGLVSPWGIRTLGAVDACGRYRPDAYHNGTIWLFDNHVIATGLRQHGLYGLADWLDENIVQTCQHLAMYPEFIRGDSVEWPGVTEYTVDVVAARPVSGTFKNRIAQPPQLMQGWTLAAYLDATHDLHRYPVQATDPDRRSQEKALLAHLGPRAGARVGGGPTLERPTLKR